MHGTTSMRMQQRSSLSSQFYVKMSSIHITYPQNYYNPLNINGRHAVAWFRHGKEQPTLRANDVTPNLKDMSSKSNTRIIAQHEIVSQPSRQLLLDGGTNFSEIILLSQFIFIQLKILFRRMSGFVRAEPNIDTHLLSNASQIYGMLYVYYSP